MAKIDKIKETLNTLRVLLSLTVGLILGLSAKVSDLYDKNIFDIRFYLSIITINLLIVVILYIAIKIKKKYRWYRGRIMNEIILVGTAMFFVGTMFFVVKLLSDTKHKHSI